ncbi:MAG: sulfotransferase family protein [Pseudomonadota bacterium]
MWPRVSDDSVRTPGLTIESVDAMLHEEAERGAVFIKDFPHYVTHMWDEQWLSRFNHSFLIRDPAKTISSMYDKWPDFHPQEVGFAEQRALFDLLTDVQGKPPPVLDSDDLLEAPHEMVERWCHAVGIDYIPEALSWEPGARDEVSWWDGGSFHANLKNSNGLKAQPRRYVEVKDAPARVQEVYGENLPHYEHLYGYRLGRSS